MGKDVTKRAETAVTVVDFSPINPVPKEAKTPLFDWHNPNLTFDDVDPANYFSMQDLQVWLKERGADGRVLNVTGASTEWVFDPEKGEATGKWKPCLRFAETETMLVINHTRKNQLKEMTHSPFLRDWAKVGHIVIRPDIAEGHAQIVIDRAPMTDEEDEQLNEALFN